MKSVNRAKLDLIIAVTAFGTIGIFVRYINLPSSVIAFVRGAVGAVFLLLLLYFGGQASSRIGSCWLFPARSSASTGSRCLKPTVTPPWPPLPCATTWRRCS